ncbi:MAG: hypothetical protein ACRDHY_12145 [Anaerolineales bacterium]
MDRRSWDLRLAWAAAGIAGFLWLGIEDQGLAGVFAVAGLLCSAIGLTVLHKRGRGPAWAMLIGLVLGSAVPLAAILLMFLKVSLHSHPVPEFTPDDVRAALSRIPMWALAGLLAGAATAILRADRRG